MRLQIGNFRSIENQELELAPITVVYGPNSSGKSTLLYALPTLRNVVLNSNQKVDGFFNYEFINLGGFRQIVFDHNENNEVVLGITRQGEAATVTYRVVVGRGNEGRFSLSIREFDGFNADLNLDVEFPYPANRDTQHTLGNFEINWDGITARVHAEAEHQDQGNELLDILHDPVETLRRIAIVPLKRGFSRPNYSPQSVPPIPVREEELAALLSDEKYLVSRVSYYLEQTLGRDFRVNSRPGTGVFSLDATDRETGVASELVNEGFGVNQLVYLFALCLHSDTELVCIEEPEVHLHPSAVRQVARAFVQIVREEGKRFLISTHSESFVLALLTLVAQGTLDPSQLAFYLAQKDRKSTKFEPQVVNEDGQIEGGLASFMAGEIEDIGAFFASTVDPTE